MGQAESVPAEGETPETPESLGEQGQAGTAARPSALVIVGPSGVGKGTLITRLMEGDPRFGFSCSHTTRPPREGEVDGVHYHYTTHEAFEADIAAGKFLEHAHVHKNIYGTSIQAVQDVANSGRCCVLDIDVQGARQVRKSGLNAVFVFIAPPSLEELEARLRGRATDSEEQITTRLRNAQEEVQSVNEAGLYDHIIVNADVEDAYVQLAAVAQRALAGEQGPAAAGGASGAAAGGAAAAAAGTPATASLRSAGPASPGAAGAAGLLPLGNAATFKTWLPPQQPGSPAVGEQQQQQAAPLPSGAAAVAAAGGYGLEQHRGRVAVVTGAGSGVGWELATSLALAGLRVVAVSRRKAQLEKLQASVLEAGVSPAEFLPVVCDLTKEAEVAALPRIVAKRWPEEGAHILINNAAASRTDVSLMDGSTAGWVETVSTNVLGTALVTREVVQDMAQRQQWGHILSICCAEQGSGMHAVTKQAMEALNQELRQEARARGVPLKVSTIQPAALNSYFFRARAAGNQTPAAAADAAAAGAGAAAAEDGAADGAADADGTPAAAGAGGRVLLHASDVVAAVAYCLSAPEHVDVSTVSVRSVWA